MDEHVKGRIHLIETFGTADGPGVRYVLFLQGCPLTCLYCHNPDTWDKNGGSVESVAEILKDVRKYLSFIEGITLSGGEPLMQPEFALALIRGAKAMGLHTAIDTSGAIALAKCKAVIDEADMVLLDVKTADPGFYDELTGGRLVSVVGLLDYLESVGKPVWARHVIVPGLTADERRLGMLASLLIGYKCIEKTELLPFHKMGEDKWGQAGIEYKLANTPPASNEEMELAEKILRQAGINVFAKKL